MVYCKDCKFRKTIANTDETNQIICCYLDSWQPRDQTQDCPFIPEKKPYKCEDCDHFEWDTACMTQEADDEFANECVGFEDKKIVMIKEMIASLWTMGRIDKEDFLKELEKFMKTELVTPMEKEKE